MRLLLKYGGKCYNKDENIMVNKQSGINIDNTTGQNCEISTQLPSILQTRIRNMLAQNFNNTSYNCFGAAEFAQIKTEKPTFIHATKIKGKEIDFDQLSKLDISVPFGVQFVGPNIRYEDSFDEVGHTVIESLHEAIVIQKNAENVTIFEKRGGEAPKICQLGESWEYYNSLTDNQLSLRVFTMNT